MLLSLVGTRSSSHVYKHTLPKIANGTVVFELLAHRRTANGCSIFVSRIRGFALLKDKKPKTISGRRTQRDVVAPSDPKVLSPTIQNPPLNAHQGAKIVSPVTPELIYPPSLLIYHAGTPRTAFLAVVKLTSIFIFVFGSIVLAPTFYLDPTEPAVAAVAIVGASAFPLIFMTMTTAPFVTYVHLALPRWARASQARLTKYVQNLPPTAAMDITTLKWIWPRVTRLRAGELYFGKGKLGGPLTLRREIPKEVWLAKRWYDWRPLKRFFVGGSSKGIVRENGIWEEVIGSISRGWNSQGKKSI